ncbi:MAG: sodium:hydrogen antiporter, partial [Segetibacter sp.]|nr:sodium:hydrogen antiporter [Segetibacter sp.]
NFITVADPNPGWKGPLVIGWAGMRGVVSLAAALSIPLVINQGQPFPYRNLILFITFIVILVTLVFQGLTLPWLVRKIKLDDKHQVIPEEEQEIIIQKKIAEASLQLLEEKYGKEREQNQHLQQLFLRFQTDIDFHELDGDEKTAGNNTLRSYQHINLELLQQQRTLLNKMNSRSEFDEDLIRKHLSLIDLEELKLRGKLQ